MRTQNRLFQRGYGRKGWLLLGVCSVLVAISWSGLLDQFALTDIDNSLKDAAILFGLARGLNALISMFQSLEMSVVVANIAIGEVLDPFNDLIERFSAVMTVALASLAGQKVLLVATATPLFNALITSVLLLVGIALLFAQRMINVALRLFWVVVFIRISLGLVIIANLLVDYALFQDQEAEHTRNALVLQDEISANVESLSSSDAQFTRQMEKLNEQQEALMLQRDGVAVALSQQQRQLRILETEQASLAEGEGALQRLNPLKERSQEEQRLIAEMIEVEGSIQQRDQELAALDQQLETLAEELACVETRKNGGSCSLGEWFANKTSVASMKEKIASTTAALEATIESFIYLIAIVVMKSIILPLLFWVVLYRAIQRLWRVDFQRLLNCSPDGERL